VIYVAIGIYYIHIGVTVQSSYSADANVATPEWGCTEQELDSLREPGVKCSWKKQ
jgi:hypothetical protein